MSELSHYIKVSSSPSGCDTKLFECDKYLDCDSCLEDKIKEHDRQIKAEVIDEVSKAMYHQCFECDNDEKKQKLLIVSMITYTKYTSVNFIVWQICANTIVQQ